MALKVAKVVVYVYALNMFVGGSTSLFHVTHASSFQVYALKVHHDATLALKSGFRVKFYKCDPAVNSEYYQPLSPNFVWSKLPAE